MTKTDYDRQWNEARRQFPKEVGGTSDERQAFVGGAEYEAEHQRTCADALCVYCAEFIPGPDVQEHAETCIKYPVHKMEAQMKELVEAAQAVVESDHNVYALALHMGNLRAALAKYKKDRK